MDKHIILISSPSGAGCDAIKDVLQRQGNLKLRTHVMADSGFVEVPSSDESHVQLMVLDLGDNGEQLLMDWSSRNGGQRLPMIVIGPKDNGQLMRRAMQAGARDYLMHPIAEDDLLASVNQVLMNTEESSESRHDGGRLTAVINAKGGSGASVVACNLAHILSSYLNRRTALFDMDLQFGALPSSFDLNTRENVTDVLASIDQLDPVALRGYMTRHQSELEILGAMSEQLVMPWEVSVDALRKLLDLSIQTYEHVVVDLPREIGPVSGVVLGSADRILVVMQQSFAHLRDAKRMFGLLNNYLGVPNSKITLVINRHTDKNPITIDDVRDAVNPTEVMFMPNDFMNVTESLNLGEPLYQKARNAPITKSLCRMAERVDAGTETKKEEKKEQHRWTLPRMLGMQS